MNLFPSAFSVLSAILVSSCATSYQPNGASGGFSDTQLATDTYRIVFNGNGFTDSTRSEDFALLRAAELTLQNGYAYFVIINGGTTKSVSSHTTPGYATTTANASAYTTGNAYLNSYGGSYSGVSNSYGSAQTTYTPPQTYVTVRPSTGILVRAFNSKPAKVFSFDAQFITNTLKQKYKIK